MIKMFFALSCIVTIVSLVIISKLTRGRDKSPTCLNGKCAIVTGGNSGIGYQVCLNLASRGCRIILADKDDSALSCQTIIEQTGNRNVVGKYLDLTSFASIRKFVSEIESTEERIDILINNAGIGHRVVIKTEDGLNPMMQVNYFGPMLLTTLLLGLLKKSAPSRIIFTSSYAAYIGSISAEDLTLPDRRTIFPGQNYADSKLAILAASRFLSERLKNTGVTSNCVHPGVVKTNIFWRNIKSANPVDFLVAFEMYLFSLVFGTDVWDGAQTITYAALSREVENVSGKFFSECRVVSDPPQIRSEKFCEKIWKTTEKYFSI